MTRFANKQRADQTRHFADFPDDPLMPGWPYRLRPEHAALNLNPTIRTDILQHFAAPSDPIQWHQHANHALSSQVCCLNFLAPLMRRPDTLAQVIASALGIETPRMLPVAQDRTGAEIFVDFECIGAQDYLSEAPKTGKRTRGANATSSDAVARMRDASGKITTILIEWKYTETYGAPISASGNPTRIERYAQKTFDPQGPIRADLGLTLQDFFWEPFYQLLRQQMLAFRMEQAREAGADRVIVLHISASGNDRLHHVTAPALRRFGTEAFATFRSLLVTPDRFAATSIEAAFRPALIAALAQDHADPWAAYLGDRYSFLNVQPE